MFLSQALGRCVGIRAAGPKPTTRRARIERDIDPGLSRPSKAPRSHHFPQSPCLLASGGNCCIASAPCLANRSNQSYLDSGFIQRTRVTLLPEASASVPFGFVLVRVRVRVQQPGAPSPTWTRDSVSSYSSGHPHLLFPRNRASRTQNTGYAQPAATRPF
jgi:hypothetical protein